MNLTAIYNAEDAGGMAKAYAEAADGTASSFEFNTAEQGIVTVTVPAVVQPGS